MLERLGYTVESYIESLEAAAAFAAAPDRYVCSSRFRDAKLDGVELARRIWERARDYGDPL